MAFLDFKNLRVAGFSVGVPSRIVVNDTVRSTEYAADAFVEKIGVKQRRITHSLTTSDLCYGAAERLIADLGWNKKEIEALIFVSQTPDYLLPATSCILQDRLGLSKECHAIDISLGCSGWTYGLSVLAGLMANGSIQKGLLLVGDSKRLSTGEKDAEKFGLGDPLFGHAGTATAIEYKEGVNGLQFHSGTDGSGYDAIIIPEGGARKPFNEHSLEFKTGEDGISRCGLQSVMKGMDVFAFGITTAPRTVRKLLERIGKSMDEVDFFVFHQANQMMNQQIYKKLKLPAEKVAGSMYEFGNTSSASIPLTIATQLSDALKEEKKRFIACGFGVGLSWCTVYFELDKPVVSGLVELDEVYL
jgi:3-oxoacyl-[acyl-carrier-protein] synthase-3